MEFEEIAAKIRAGEKFEPIRKQSKTAPYTPATTEPVEIWCRREVAYLGNNLCAVLQPDNSASVLIYFGKTTKRLNGILGTMPVRVVLANGKAEDPYVILTGYEDEDWKWRHRIGLLFGNQSFVTVNLPLICGEEDAPLQ